MTKEEFTRQVEGMTGTLHRVSCAYLRRECDRLDAVQEALLKAWQSLGSLREEQYFRTWLTRILIRECVNIHRSARRMIPVSEIPDGSAPENSGNPALKDAILCLPEHLRIPVVLFYMEGYGVEEIAKTLRVPKGTVCSRLARARKRLERELKEEALC